VSEYSFLTAHPHIKHQVDSQSACNVTEFSGHSRIRSKLLGKLITTQRQSPEKGEYTEILGCW